MSTPSVKRNVLMSWFAHGVTIVIGFFLMPYVVSVLGDRAYGSWVFINSLASYSGLLYFGFGDTISRYVAKHHAAGEYQKLNQVVTLVLAIYLVMGGVALLIGLGLCAAAPYLTQWESISLQEIRLTMVVLAINVAVGLAGSVFGGVLMGLRRFDQERTISLSSDVLRLALILVFLRQEWGILTIALIYLVIAITENTAYVVLAFRNLPQLQVHRRYLSWETFKDCSSFSSMAFLNAIAYQMTFATDSVVIGFAMGTERIVPYYIALRLAQFIKQPIEKIAQICMPTAGALAVNTDRSKLQRFVLQAFGVVLLLSVGMWVGAWFFGGHVIATWMGEGYTESHHILIILLASQAISSPTGVLRAFLFGMGHVRTPAILYLIEAVCNLGLSLVLVQYWGLSGVAWGTMLPVALIELTLTLPIALQLLQISYRRLWTEAVAPQLLPLAALSTYAWCLSQQPLSFHNWPMLITVTAGGACVLAVTWLLTGRGMPQRQATAAA
ncbi:oligosaccharide flippase family protein [bacterium]|nr:oligosaccharide flippase family protein [bacterium]